ncbi:MAG: hypothetical protein DRJ51_00195 [Thermoprotei archaeon]|nr:MAG: hypothetical protein DRJ51_00195 [Thermoprotei archaeon]
MEVTFLERKGNDLLDKLTGIIGPLGKVERRGPKRYYVYTSSENIKEIVNKLLKELGDCYISAITGVELEDCFRVYYHIWNFTESVLLSIITETSKEKPEVPSLTDIIPGAIFHENEAYDLLGIKFIGHPNLRKNFVLPDNSPPDFFPLRMSQSKRGES